jgi:mannose-6-phosphate isomerase-like protein (cupin superfamily)
MTAVAKRIQTFQGTLERLPAGEQVERKSAEPFIAAVVSGRVRLRLGEETVMLRASDAAAVPAHARYRLEVLDDSVLYHYTEPVDESLWGV